MSLTKLSRDDALEVYLNDHLTGASAGVDLFRRVARSYSDPDVRRVVSRLADEVDKDRRALLAIMRRVGSRPSWSSTIIGRVGERLGRLKPNGSLIRRTNLTDLVELEALMLGVRGKLACWHTLAEMAVNDPIIGPAEVDELTERANSQLRELESLRRGVAASVLGGQ
jgi:hypothetical protein